jgi:phenylalanyl-tRNA synthetase beta chain
MDLVEEYARLHGYDKLGETLPAGGFSPATHDEAALLLMRVRRQLKGFGCLEAINYAFVGDRYQKSFLGDVSKLREAGLHVADEDVKIVNPLNEDINVMRRSLLPGLYRNVVSNFRSGNYAGRLFEVGASTHRASGARVERYPGTSFGEELRLGLAFWGSEKDLWGRSQAPEVTMVLKGILESFWRSFGLGDFKVEAFEADLAPDFLHPGKSARIMVRGQAVGFLGALHPSVISDDKVRVGVALCEVSLERLAAAVKIPKFQQLSTFPTVERDVAFVTAKSVPAGEIVEHIRKTARGLEPLGRILRDLSVFDVFEGEALGDQKRSVAIRMIFQSQEATLSDDEVNDLREKLVNAACQKFEAVVRS